MPLIHCEEADRPLIDLCVLISQHSKNYDRNCHNDTQPLCASRKERFRSFPFPYVSVKPESLKAIDKICQRHPVVVLPDPVNIDIRFRTAVYVIKGTVLEGAHPPVSGNPKNGSSGS